jgi:hypothetical protein
MNERSGRDQAFGAGTEGRATMQINTVATFVAALMLGTGLIGRVHTQECSRGDLDKTYCDRWSMATTETPGATSLAADVLE